MSGQRWIRLRAKKFLFASLGLHALWMAVAALWTYHAVRAGSSAETPSFRSAPAPNRASQHALEHHAKLTRLKGGAPPVAKRAVTVSLSQVALPAVPAVAPMPFVRPAVLVSGRHQEAMGSTGTGRGPGSGGSDGEEDVGRALKNLFTKLQVTEQRVGVVFEVPRTAYTNPPNPAAAEYLRNFVAEREYLERTFGPKRLAEYIAPCLYVPWHRNTDAPTASLGSAILDMMDSPEQLEAIYVLGQFGWVSVGNHEHGLRKDGEKVMNMIDPYDLWPTIQKRVRERKVKLYIHMISDGDRLVWMRDTLLSSFLDLARGTGGTVKIGPIPHPGEEIPAPSP